MDRAVEGTIFVNHVPYTPQTQRRKDERAVVSEMLLQKSGLGSKCSLSSSALTLKETQ